MATGKIVGVPTPRAEGVGKVTGEAVYAVDVTLPDMVWGKVLRSPIPYGRIKRIDTGRAKQPSGVRAVVTGADVAGLCTALIQSDLGSGPYNSMSIGETPIIPFASAVADAAGSGIRSLPVTAEKVLPRMSV